MRRYSLLTLLSFVLVLSIQAQKVFHLKSPNGHLSAQVELNNSICYSLSMDGKSLISPSTVSLALGDGHVVGLRPSLKSSRIVSHQGDISSFFYKKAKVTDNYEQLTLTLADGFSLVFRIYDEGLAYRFVSSQKQDFFVADEQAEFNFADNWNARIAYTNTKGNIANQLMSSFENCYVRTTLSNFEHFRLAFLPLLVEADNGVKICITEADLENYPGMYLRNGLGGACLKGFFATYPHEIKKGSLMSEIEQGVVSRENYLVKAQANQQFPWRIISVSSSDEQLLDNDMVYRLAAPSRISDTSWIRPGKVAWEWWNGRGLYGVPFKAGNNNDTYKYYIDFAAKHHIEYIILDGGWSDASDLLKVAPTLNLPELIAYGKEKGVDIILWASFYAFDKQMEIACRHYSQMGAKGFKVDFINRDDAMAVNFHYRAASVAAKYKLLLDFHGTYKPTGLSRTFPNVLNYEGVNGLEQNRWSTMETYNQVPYDTELPFIRMLAGQMDYTQGAMLNSTRKTYHMSDIEPMSQGTRCHQLGEYVVFFSPLNMLCDSPTHYEKEPECTNFISAVPTIWDETYPLKCEVGEYVAVARRNGDVWYIGVINNWTARDLILPLDFLPAGNYHAEVFADGLNADRHAQDFQRQELSISSNQHVSISLAPGGGWAARIYK